MHVVDPLTNEMGAEKHGGSPRRAPPTTRLPLIGSSIKARTSIYRTVQVELRCMKRPSKEMQT
jgi:hypothetical protein